MRDWVVICLLASTVSNSPWLFHFLCRMRWIVQIEQHVLERKYGDLAMFRSYFLQEAQRRRSTRAL